MVEKITIEEQGQMGGLFFVQCGDKFASMLTRDEVLGVVASALFSPHGPIFVRTYESEVAATWSPAGKSYAEGEKLLLAIEEHQ